MLLEYTQCYWSTHIVIGVHTHNWSTHSVIGVHRVIGVLRVIGVHTVLLEYALCYWSTHYAIGVDTELLKYTQCYWSTHNVIGVHTVLLEYTQCYWSTHSVSAKCVHHSRIYDGRSTTSHHGPYSPLLVQHGQLKRSTTLRVQVSNICLLEVHQNV